MSSYRERMRAHEEWLLKHSTAKQDEQRAMAYYEDTAFHDAYDQKVRDMNAERVHKEWGGTEQPKPMSESQIRENSAAGIARSICAGAASLHQKRFEPNAADTRVKLGGSPVMHYGSEAAVYTALRSFHEQYPESPIDKPLQDMPGRQRLSVRTKNEIMQMYDAIASDPKAAQFCDKKAHQDAKQAMRSMEKTAEKESGKGGLLARLRGKSDASPRRIGVGSFESAIEDTGMSL